MCVSRFFAGNHAYVLLDVATLTMATDTGEKKHWAKPFSHSPHWWCCEMWKIAAISCAVSSHIGTARSTEKIEEAKIAKTVQDAQDREVLIVGDKIHAFARDAKGTHTKLMAMFWNPLFFLSIQIKVLCVRQKRKICYLSAAIGVAGPLWKCVALMVVYTEFEWESFSAATSDRNKRKFYARLLAELWRLLRRITDGYGDAYEPENAHNKPTETIRYTHVTHSNGIKWINKEREREERTSPKAVATTNYIHLRVEFQNSLNKW